MNSLIRWSWVVVFVGRVPVYAVWPYYEEVELQTQSGTTPYPGFVAIVTFYLVLVQPLSTVLLIILSLPTFCILMNPFRQCLAELHHSVAPYSPPIFRYRFNCPPAHRPLPTASIDCPGASLLCLPWPTTQCPSRPLNSCAADPFLPPLTPYVSPPFANLNVVSVPIGLSGLYLPRVHPPASNVLVRSPPLLPLICRIMPLLVTGSFTLRVSGYLVLLPVCYPLFLPFVSPSIGVLWYLMVLFNFLRVSFCTLERGRAPPLSGNCLYQPFPMRYSAMPAVFTPPPPPLSL